MTLNEVLNTYLTPNERVKYITNMDMVSNLHTNIDLLGGINDFVSSQFVWSDSPEGHGYWLDVESMLLDGSGRLLPPSEIEHIPVINKIIYTTISKHRMI